MYLLCDCRISDEKEQAELQELWNVFQELCNKETIRQEAKELMSIDESSLKSKENDLELLILRLNKDESIMRSESELMKLLQEEP